MIDCESFSKSNEDIIEVHWTYTILNGCSFPISARRAMIMKCHRCPILGTNNGPNECSSDISFFRDAADGDVTLVDGMSSYALTETEAVDLTKTCDMSLLVTSVSRFLAIRISSADETEEVANTQATAAQSLGPVCRVSTEVWPGMKGCQSETIYDNVGAVGNEGADDGPAV